MPDSDGLLMAASSLDASGSSTTVERIVRERIPVVDRDDRAASAVAARSRGDLADVLAEALRARARRGACRAFLLTASITPQRDAVREAVENLDADEHGMVANALESLEAAIRIGEVRRLTRLWETTPSARPVDDADLGLLLEDRDGFVRRCAAALLEPDGGREGTMRDQEVLSAIERLVVLRRVPIFATLEPAELNDLADRTEEHVFDDGEELERQGDTGDRLHVILSGTVDVIREGSDGPLAVRGEGDVVGEMSIVSREPRVAGLVARGPVRTMTLSRAEFDALVRERPEVGLSVMGVLARRLAEATRGGSGTTDQA
jgi:hypothetical protein